MNKPTVLIVDDAIYMRVVLKDLLERNGFSVIAMEKNGLLGVRKYEQLYAAGQRPDLVIMDITMKVMRGIEALKEIKKIDNKCNVVMLTSVAEKEATVEAVQAGATYFIHKPFEDEKLIATLQKAIQKR